MIKTKCEYKSGLADLIYYLEAEPEYGSDEGVKYDILINELRA